MVESRTYDLNFGSQEILIFFWRSKKRGDHIHVFKMLSLVDFGKFEIKIAFFAVVRSGRFIIFNYFARQLQSVQ